MAVATKSRGIVPLRAIFFLAVSMSLFDKGATAHGDSADLEMGHLYLVSSRTAADLPEGADIGKLVKGNVRKWRDGSPLVLVLPKASCHHFETVGKRWFGSGAGMQRAWLALVFSGRANTPIFVDEEEMHAAITSDRNRVGILAEKPEGSLNLLDEESR